MPRATSDLTRLTQGGPSRMRRRPLQVGRETKLTPEVSKKICDAVRAGNYPSVAARYAGVSPSTLYVWRRKAEDATTRNVYVQFIEDLDAAEAFAEVSANLHWRAAMPKDWHASERWLQTRYPERYASGRDGTTQQTAVQVNLGGIPAPTAEQPLIASQSISRLLEANPDMIASTMSVLDALLPKAGGDPTPEIVDGDWREVPATVQDTQDELSFHRDSVDE